MLKKLRVYLQYILPQHFISAFFGKLSASQNLWIKSNFIKYFIKRYQVDMTQAEIEDPSQYRSFEDFFTRKLKSTSRPVSEQKATVICPVDGTVAEIGKINKNQLLQAKGSYFNLESLLGNDEEVASYFIDGEFATLYLSPKDYHRIHMPLDGRLKKTTFIPGKLFSVNRMTSDLIPNLYTRNERLICLFETEIGRMAVILVGAMIVGSMQVSWMNKPIKSKQVLFWPQNYFNPDLGPFLKKGEELGHFKLGSTVIVLFEKNKIEWSSALKSGSPVQFGQILANFLNGILN